MTEERYKPWLSLQAAGPLVRKQLGDDQNSAADALIKAATGITEAAAKIERTVPPILGNKLGSSLANTQAARRTIAKIVGPALKRVSEATDYANAAVASLTEKSSPAMPDDVTGTMLHQEVRSALLRMNDAERRKAIATAISSGDETFIAAATSGSPTLSGMTAVEQSVAREQWRTKHHPETAACLTRLRNAISQLDRLGPMLTKWSDGLVAEPDKAAAAAAEQSAMEATRATS